MVSIKANPKVSIIIPVYNTGKYLRECLDSVINQTLKELEIICINDGSTDNSASILEEYRKKDNRFIIINKENGGQSSARNIGIKRAKGDYLYFLDSDDLINYKALQILYDKAYKNDLDVIYFDGFSFFENKFLERKHHNYLTYYAREKEYSDIISGEELFVKMVQDKVYRVSPCLQLIKRSYLVDINLLFYEGIIYEDNLFTFLCMIQAKKVCHLKERFFYRRVREESTMTKPYKFINLKGYLICFIYIMQFSFKHYYNDEVLNCIRNELTGIYYNIKRIYSQLSLEELTKINNLNPMERFILDSLIQPKPNINQITKLENELFSMSNSKSFKIGRLITYFPRKILQVYYCWKDNGGIYTLKKIREKLFL